MRKHVSRGHNEDSLHNEMRRHLEAQPNEPSDEPNQASLLVFLRIAGSKASIMIGMDVRGAEERARG